MNDAIKIPLFTAGHITDLHFNPLGRIPQSRSETYHEDTSYEWKGFCHSLEENNVDSVLISGDLFNLKNQSLYSPSDMNYYRGLVGALPADVLTTPGNHDLPKSSLDLIAGTAYQNMVDGTKNVTNLIFDTKHYPVVVPGVENGLLNVFVTGIPYLPFEKFKDTLSKVNDMLADKKGIHIIMMHPDALPRDDLPMHFDTMSYAEILEAVPNGHVFCFGHIHASFPVYNRVNQKTGRAQMVSKPFSFARIVKDYFASADDIENLHRPMWSKITIYTTASEPGKITGTIGIDIEYQELPYVPFERAFIRDTLRQEIEKSGRVSGFISKLRQDYGSVQNAFEVETPEEFLNRAKVPDRIRAVVDSYLSSANS